MRKIRKNRDMALQASEFSLWASSVPCPRTAEEFAAFLFAENSCISLESNVLPLTFFQHIKLYHLAKEQWPILFSALYQRNEWFRALEEDIKTYEENGLTPREAMLRCIRGLELGGARMTGDILAARAAIEAAGLFHHYLDTMPDEISENIKALRATDGKTIAEVLNDLAHENCVESAASNLKKILENPTNNASLDARPSLNQEELNKIEEKYNHLDSTTIKLSVDNSSVPIRLCNDLIRTITLTESHELYTLLINFPMTFYGELLRELNLSQIEDPIAVIGQHIEKGFFNEEQANTLIKALLNLDDTFQSNNKLLLYLLNKPNLISTYLSSLPNDEARLTALNEKDPDGWSILHQATTSPESLEKILASFNSEQLKIRMVIEGLRKKELSYDVLPQYLKQNKEIITAAKYPWLDFVLQNSEASSASLSLITLGALEVLSSNWQQKAILAAGTTTAALTYSTMKFFTPNLSKSPPPSEQKNAPQLGPRTSNDS
jgi:hypothetical protein